MMNRESLSIVYSPELTAWSIVRNLLELADVNRKRGPVAEYLVGAKLALRFPKLSIRNSSYSAADEQVGEQGDFYVGNTAFHVTVAYAPALLAKCLANLEAGFRVYLLVPEDVADKVRYEVENRVQGRITVGSIEGFVSQNIEELSCFDGNKLKHGLRRLLEMYNERVGEVETDASLRISIPQNLL
jgi:hypothetical protein